MKTRLPKTWIYPKTSAEAERKIREALALPAPVARILAGRGFSTPAEAEKFLSSDSSDLESPFLLVDMEKAVARVRRAAEGKETVYLHGDRDVDGVTSAALLSHLLETLGIRHQTHVPSTEDGYGFNEKAAARARAHGATLALTVDCGIRDLEGITAARDAGIDVVVIDHHEPGESLPPAVAVVDPKRIDCPYPFKGLSACGVAFKFAQATLLSKDPFFENPIVVFDFETATMSRTADIVEIGAVKAVGGVIVDRFYSLVNPRKPIDEGARKAHGIADSDVASAPRIEEVLPKFLDWIGAATLAGHNVIGYDLPILEHWAGEVLGRRVRNPVIDTLPLSRTLLPGVPHNLNDLCERFGIPLANAHRADDDAEACFHLLKRLVAKRNPEVGRFLQANFDLVALSTIADVVPLSGENRILASLGLAAMRKPRRPGLAALLEKTVRSPRLRAKDIAWSVTPVINAAGRAGAASEALELLLCRSETESYALADRLIARNVERKAKQKLNEAMVVAVLEETFDPERDPAVVASVVGMERGVTGILANRLVNDLGRPVVLLIGGMEISAGTSRGVEGFDLLAAFGSCRDLLLTVGGHKGAAALSLASENVAEFRRRFQKYVRENCPPESLVPRLAIAAEVFVDEMDGSLLLGLDRLEPAGFGNETPVLLLKNMEVEEARAIGAEGRHLRLTVRAGGKRLVFLSWNHWDDPTAIPAGSRVDLAFTVEPETGRGGEAGMRCVLEDLHVKS